MSGANRAIGGGDGASHSMTGPTYSGMLMNPNIEALNRDPQWSLADFSQPRNAVLTETTPSRILSAIGFLNPRRIGDVADENYWFSVNTPAKQLSAFFYFSDIDIQQCNGLVVESIEISGLTQPRGRKVVSAMGGSLAGDIIDDDLAGSVNRYDFSNGEGILQVRTFSSASPTSEIVHNIEVFKSDGSENGWYTPEELLIAIMDKFKLFWDARFPGTPIPINVSVNAVRGTIQLAWGDAASLGAIGTTGGIQWNLNPAISTILKTLFQFVVPDRFVSSGVTAGAVVNGQAIEFWRIDGDSLGAPSSAGVAGSYPFVSFLSSELTQYQRKDSITQSSGAGCIAVADFSMGIQVAAITGNTALKANYASGSLIPAKIEFDPSASISTFTVEAVFAKGDNGIFRHFLQTLLNNHTGSLSGLAEQSIYMTIVARLF